MDEKELLKKIRALEEGQAELKREVSKLHQLRAERCGGGAHCQKPADSSSRRRRPPRAAGLPRRHHMMAMESLGQAVYVLDIQGKALYWNPHAEHLYGYSASEAIDQNITKLIIDPGDIPALNNIIGNIVTGKCWRGKLPIKNKSGERFSIVADATPLHDDDGKLMGLVCLADDTRTMEEVIGPSTSEHYSQENWFSCTHYWQFSEILLSCDTEKCGFKLKGQ